VIFSAAGPLRVDNVRVDKVGDEKAKDLTTAEMVRRTRPTILIIPRFGSFVSG